MTKDLGTEQAEQIIPMDYLHIHRPDSAHRNNPRLRLGRLILYLYTLCRLALLVGRGGTSITTDPKAKRLLQLLIKIGDCSSL